ncbi:uncharacterized protein LOC110099088, partial [Dendrobium catenatum]|uniref:uncharacterized protein LOC110099088 n=1 Tax=Dendrobium catenatum TaxID=906689 RepID=UPI0009F6986D
PDPDMTDGQSSSQALPVGSTSPVAGADTLSQFATLVAQMMSETQSRVFTVRSDDLDRHLQLFLRLKPPRFEGAVEPRAAEEWLRRLERLLMGCKAEHWWECQQAARFQGRLNSLITWDEFTEVFRDWFVPPSARQQMQETFLRLVQGSKTVMQYEAEFTALARYAPQLVSTSAERCYRFLRGLRDSLRQPLVPFHISDFSELVERARLIENDLMATQQRWTASRKRFGGEASGSGSFGKRRFVSGPGSGSDFRKSGGSSGTATSTTSSGSVSTAPMCQSCGRRHLGQCYRMAGLCFRCGQPGHRIAECPQMGSDRRSEFRSESSVRPTGSAGRPRTVPPRSEGFAGRGGGSSSAPRRPPTVSQREPSSSVASAPTPVQPRVYNLSQQEARDAPDVVTGTIHISDQPCRVLFDSGASHSFLSERCFEILHLDSFFLPISLSVSLPARNPLITRKFCLCEIDISGKKWKLSLILLPISSYDVILGMDWLSL